VITHWYDIFAGTTLLQIIFFSKVQFHFRLCSVSVLSSKYHEWSAAPTACAVSQTAVIAVNAALVVSQRQHCAEASGEPMAALHWWWANGSTARKLFLCTHEAAQAASTVCQVFGMARPGIDPDLRVSVAHSQPTLPSNKLVYRLYLCF